MKDQITDLTLVGGTTSVMKTISCKCYLHNEIVVYKKEKKKEVSNFIEF